MNKFNSSFLLLAVLFLIETLCYYCSALNYPFFSIVYFVSGLSIAVVPFFVKSISTEKNKHQWISIVYVSVFLLLTNWMVNVFRIYILHGTPPQKENADMLLFVKIMVERFLNGDAKIYDKIIGVWGTAYDAIYLPAMWLPFSIPVAFGFDLRWATCIFVLLSLLLFFRAIYQTKTRWFLSIISIGLSALLLNRMLGVGCWYFTQTEEGVVVLYYCMLCYGLLRSNWSLVGIAIGLCLLSRFTFVIMIPAALFLLFPKHKSELIKIIVGAAVTMVVLLFVSGTFDEWQTIILIPFKYQHMLGGEITTVTLKKINENLGISKFLLWSGSAVKSLALPATLVASFLFLWLLKKVKHNRSFQFQLLCMLKLTLVIFFNFLLYSEEYLLYTSSFISLFILIGLQNNREVTAV